MYRNADADLASPAKIKGSAGLVLRAASYCGDGGRPSVALADERITILVHEGQGGTELQHCVGVVDAEGKVEWGRHHQCAKGINPCVATNDMWIVVEVHENHGESRLWCKYGIVNPETKEVTWGKSHFYGWGAQPAVSLRTDGRLVEVHEEKHLFKKSLCYRLGRIDMETRSIHWEDAIKIGKGKNPKVAVSDEGVVIEVHENDSDSGLCYTVGELKDSRIEWGEMQKYDVGVAPCVCIKNWSNQIVEVHQDATSETLQYRTGVINLKEKMIDWLPEKVKQHKGKSPGIAVGDNGTLVTVQVEASSSMACSVGSIARLLQ